MSPSTLGRNTFKVRSKILPYIIQNEIDDTRFLSLIRENFLKQWDLFNQDNSQIDNYMDAQFGMMYGWAPIENQTIVKNIIERTQDELAQEFLSKMIRMEIKRNLPLERQLCQKV